MWELRDYQQAAIAAAIAWIKRSVEPALLELATGAGKSIICTEIAAKYLAMASERKALMMVPTGELMEQNAEKYRATGEQCSLMGNGKKSFAQRLTIGMPKTIKNNLNSFCRGDYGLVIIDEAHGLDATLLTILAAMREANPQLRVIGMTATPYRTGEGYIYGYDTDGKAMPPESIREPFYHQLIYKVGAGYLIERGYLTPPHADPHHIAGYDTSGIKKHTRAEYSLAFDANTKTADIIAEIVSISANRMGVMIFAATIRHAEEIMVMLPYGDAVLVTGTLKKKERETAIKRIKRRMVKFIVNVDVLTTGFDAPHIDVIAILRATESPGLLQQIIGRGLRLHPEKQDVLVLDYAGNIERHELEDDLFDPRIKAYPVRETEKMDVCCPACGFENQFAVRPNPDGLPVGADGNLMDLTGEPVMLPDVKGEPRPLPAHFGRRCMGYSMVRGLAVRCEHRWSSKECPNCRAFNDIAARECEKCKEKLVDPDTELREEFHRLKKDASQKQVDIVRDTHYSIKNSRKDGSMLLIASFTTDYRNVDIIYKPASGVEWQEKKYAELSMMAFGVPNAAPSQFIHAAPRQPETITYSRKKGSKFYNIRGFNEPAQICHLESDNG